MNRKMLRNGNFPLNEAKIDPRGRRGGKFLVAPKLGLGKTTPVCEWRLRAPIWIKFLIFRSTHCGWCSSRLALSGEGQCRPGTMKGPVAGSCPGNLTWNYVGCPLEDECLNAHHTCDSVSEVCEDLEIGFRCICAPGFTPIDSHCEPVCQQGCVHGTCAAPNDCQCDFGYVGSNCSIHCQVNKTKTHLLVEEKILMIFLFSVTDMLIAKARIVWVNVFSAWTTRRDHSANDASLFLWAMLLIMAPVCRVIIIATDTRIIVQKLRINSPFRKSRIILRYRWEQGPGNVVGRLKIRREREKLKKNIV